MATRARPAATPARAAAARVVAHRAQVAAEPAAGIVARRADERVPIAASGSTVQVAEPRERLAALPAMKTVRRRIGG